VKNAPEGQRFQGGAGCYEITAEHSYPFEHRSSTVRPDDMGPGWSGAKPGTPSRRSNDSRPIRRPPTPLGGRAMRKFFMVIMALIVAVVVGVVIFRRITEEQ
jgi:hypothetical protein